MTNDPPPSKFLELVRPTRAKVIGGLVLTIVVLGLVWWFDGGRWNFFPRHFGTIEEGVLFRSGQIDARLIEDVIDEHGIEVIVDLSGRHELDDDRRAEREVAQRRGVRLVELKTLDGSGIGDIEDYVVALSEMIHAHETKTPLLVHCSAGTQRTGAATAWFRMLVQGWSGAEAHAEYMRYRYDRPDSGRLGRYMNEHARTLVDRLVEEGALPERPASLPHFGPE